MACFIVISQDSTGEVVSILVVAVDVYKQISERYFCGWFDLEVNDIKNIVQEGTVEEVYAYFNINANVQFWHLNVDVRYSLFVCF